MNEPKSLKALSLECINDTTKSVLEEAINFNDAEIKEVAKSRFFKDLRILLWYPNSLVTFKGLGMDVVNQWEWSKMWHLRYIYWLWFYNSNATNLSSKLVFKLSECDESIWYDRNWDHKSKT